MTIKPILLAAGCLGLAACGAETVTGEPDPSASAQASGSVLAETAVPAKQTNSGDPEIGQRIPDPEESNTLAAAGAAAKALEARGVREIGWEELMPEGEEERLAQIYQQQMAALYSSPVAEGSAADKMVQVGTFNTVAELNEVKVRLPGYTVPFEYGANAEITEFLLVPYFGACLHAPPPPPNQTIFVMTDDPIRLRDLAQAVWIEGTLYTQTQESELADAAYTIKLDAIETYEY